jgi:PD-(D/E)XK nuclease superfamily
MMKLQKTANQLTDRKIFDHELLDYIDLTTQTINGKRYYVAPDGQLFPSVTTVLSYFKSDAIQEWRDRVGSEQANRISRQASARGTGMHAICEDYVNNKRDIYKGRMPTEIELFKQIRPVIDEHLDRVYGIEIPLLSFNLKTAGRCDLFCRFMGTNTILDFKTSSKDKKEEWIEDYFIQATCYAMMVEEMYSTQDKPIFIPQLAILIAVSDGENKYQLYVKKTNDYRELAKTKFSLYHANNPAPEPIAHYDGPYILS